jgi:hypothetical protein
MKDWQIGDEVFVVADNCGSPATIIDEREPGGSGPSSRYKVRTDEGGEFWAYDFEIQEAQMPKDESWGDTFRRLVATGHDHAYAADRADQKFPRPKHEPTKAEIDTLTHIGKVRTRVNEVTRNLEARAWHHDASKVREPERSGYETLTINLADCEYGSDAYRAALAEARDTIAHHYAENDHHPEHYPNGIAGMSLLAVLEMLCDWKAASERTRQGSIAQSLEHNKKRFGIDDQLASILENTVRELGW